MSRIGKKIIVLPAGVSIEEHNRVLKVSGPKGNLEIKLLKGIDFHHEDGSVHFTRINDEKVNRQNHGTVEALVHNAVVGVSEGFKKQLEIVGIGYRAALRGENLVLNVGYSHEVVIVPDTGVKITCPSATEVVVEGIDAQCVGQTAARIRAVREPEPYNGKGIKYKGEHIIRKEGKRANAKK